MSKDEITSEEWFNIPGFEKLYQLSNCQRVRSLDRRVWLKGNGGTWHWRTVKGCILKQQINGNGRLQVGLSKNGVTTIHRIHRLVSLVSLGPCPPGMQCCHNDGNYLNNKPENLRYDTCAGNHADKKIHGTNNDGSKHGNSKLVEVDILEIRRKYSNGNVTMQELAIEYGVVHQNIARIVNGEMWRHLPFENTGNKAKKLTEKEVVEIRLRYSKGGVLQRELAKIYGVNQTLISHIVTRKIWKQV